MLSSDVVLNVLAFAKYVVGGGWYSNIVLRVFKCDEVIRAIYSLRFFESALSYLW